MNMLDIQELKFDANGLIPAIVIDTETRDVLMLAYMNEESLRVSMEEGRTCFWSRSRRELWRKGETSGNVQKIVSITADCDADTLLVEVNKSGPACHTGAEGCFFQPVFSGEEPPAFRYEDLFAMLRGRKENPKAGSYTTYLFEKGIDKILKKIGEETTEVIISAKDADKANTVYEIGDLMYHVMVLMIEAGITPDDIRREMASRHVIDRKVKQEKMAASGDESIE
jgi:phosphoribosyl-ATP pyrophosphohydrolase/phosphoribosyl-AMP cyclohydrolase